VSAGGVHREPAKREIRDVADPGSAQVFSANHSKYAGCVQRLTGIDGPEQPVSMTGTKKDRAGLTGHIDVVGERSPSGDKPSVFTASHRLGNSELVCHGAWHDDDEVAGVVVPLVPCSGETLRALRLGDVTHRNCDGMPPNTGFIDIYTEARPIEDFHMAVGSRNWRARNVLCQSGMRER
jgi:hypothetical protein